MIAVDLLAVMGQKMGLAVHLASLLISDDLPMSSFEMVGQNQNYSSLYLRAHL